MNGWEERGCETTAKRAAWGGESAKKAAYFGKKKQKLLNFALPLPDSIMVVRQILDLYVEVRALVGQQKI